MSGPVLNAALQLTGHDIFLHLRGIVQRSCRVYKQHQKDTPQSVRAQSTLRRITQPTSTTENLKYQEVVRDCITTYHLRSLHTRK